MKKSLRKDYDFGFGAVCHVEATIALGMGTAGLVWFCQEVSHAGFGEDKLWVAVVYFNFLSPAPDMNPEGIHRGYVASLE